LEFQIRAEISWTKLIRRRLRPSIQIGEEEIENTYQNFKRNAGRPEHNISEILLPVESPTKAGEARQAADRLLENLRKGGNFAALARQFSASATAAQGGNIGWVQPGQLNPALDDAVAALGEGDISEPIRSGGGYYIIKLHKRRKILEADPGKTKITLKRLLLPLAKDVSPAEVKSQSDLAAAVAGTVNGCDQVKTVAEELRTKQFGDLGTVLLGEMPAKIRAAVTNLPVGRFSKPIRRDTGILLLMVCKRVKPPSTTVTRKQVEDGLISKRLAVMTQRYIRDLRRTAVVELR
jgi:peptidyl-prolyl cis-trans isomerase SurA